jgi:hypothetical protein
MDDKMNAIFEMCHAQGGKVTLSLVRSGQDAADIVAVVCEHRISKANLLAAILTSAIVRTIDLVVLLEMVATKDDNAKAIIAVLERKLIEIRSAEHRKKLRELSREGLDYLR